MIKWIFLGVVLVLIFAGIASIKRTARGAGISLREIFNMLKLAKDQPRTVEPRSVFGATSIYLPKIEQDFVDFHQNEAIAAVKVLIYEYLAIRYEGQQDFKKSQVSPQLITMVDKQSGYTVNNEQVHQVAISKYEKTKEYATITYQASVGYLLDNEPVEERYAVEYTLKLRENDIEQKTLICPQCGGTYESTRQSVCPYCGAGIVRDTIMSWKFTSISQS